MSEFRDPRAIRLPWVDGAPFHIAAVAVVGLTLVAVGQPLFTEDTWWHLSMGRAYAAMGPWLDVDPTLFTATGPPSPAAWLSSISLYTVHQLAGFQGLRVAHAIAVLTILLLAWSSLHRTSGSRAFASFGVGLFASISAYRLFQLRPDLVSIFAAVLVVWLFFARNVDATTSNPQDADADGKSKAMRKVIAAIFLMAVWANSHAGFLLGPMILAAALVAIGFARVFNTPHRGSSPARVRTLALALGFGLAATLLNPEGPVPHLLYFSAGGETPDLALVADEWRRIDLLQVPDPNLPPSVLTWILVWGLLIFAPLLVALSWRKLRSRPAELRDAKNGVDPSLIGIAALSLIAMLAAVRFIWMGLFVLIAIGACARSLGWLEPAQRPTRRVPAVAVLAATAVAMVYGFANYGAWPMISKGIHQSTYARPYTAAKNHAHAVWFLRDTALEGNLYNTYASGNFLGYWLAPRLRTFVNGSLNVPKETMDVGFAIERRGWESDERFEDMLDRKEIDVFFATGTPRLSLPGRPVINSTTHLERTPGWTLVFRSLSTAIYLRANDRNQKNLARVADYYAQMRVPFDAKSGGFQVERALLEAPQWAIAHGLIPSDFRRLQSAARVAKPTSPSTSSERLAGLYATIGLYGRALEIDRQTVRLRPMDVAPSRRLVWTLLRLGRFDEARVEAGHLSRIARADDSISSMLITSAGHVMALPEDQQRALIAVLPMMTRLQARQIGKGFVEPEVRESGGAGCEPIGNTALPGQLRGRPAT